MKKENEKELRTIAKTTLIAHLRGAFYILVILVPAYEINGAVMRAFNFTGGPMPILSCPTMDDFWNACYSIPEFLLNHFLIFPVTAFFHYKFQIMLAIPTALFFAFLLLSQRKFSDFYKKIQGKRLYIAGIILYGGLFMLALHF